MRAGSRSSSRGRAAALLAGCGLVASVLAPAGPASADTLGGIHQLPQTGSFAVYVRGNGHGHGLSQYGAEGAAAHGLSTTDILAFYYPGARRAVLPDSRIRVKLSGVAADTTVFATTPGLRLCRHDPLPLSGVRYYRLAPSGSGLALQRQRIGASSWETVTSNLPSSGCFASDTYFERLLNSDGSSTRYHGYLRAVRSGSGEITVNDVSLDNYAAGVTPQEMPTSWYHNAVHAQAIAARTYGRYAVEHPAGSNYDICDTTSCQVYGGMAQYAKDGTLQSVEQDPDVIVGNENTVLTYQGHAIFAQFSASNGGAEAYGGFPYLPAKVDPYDSYPTRSSRATASQVASYYGLKRATALEITKRDGIGPWGGRVVSGYVDGVTSSGGQVRWATTGAEIGAALGVYTSYLGIDTSG
jgi:stage II sporulation protein D